MDYLWHSVGVLLQCIGGAILILAMLSPMLYMMYIDYEEGKRKL